MDDDFDSVAFIGLRFHVIERVVGGGCFGFGFVSVPLSSLRFQVKDFVCAAPRPRRDMGGGCRVGSFLENCLFVGPLLFKLDAEALLSFGLFRSSP